MAEPFWLNRPAILLNKDRLTEVWPDPKMGFNRKLNALTRLIIALTILGYLATRSPKLPVSALITVVVVVIIYKTNKHNDIKRKIGEKIVREGFTNPALYKATQNSFTNPTPANPLMNVLLPEIKYNPQRKPAAPSFNRAVETQVNEKAGNVGPDPKLFLDLGDAISFETSMRNFHPTANTRIPNDQGAFAKYLYGDMPSCRDGDGIQCEKDAYRWINY